MDPNNMSAITQYPPVDQQETYDEQGRRLDSQGRPPVEEMTDIEMMTETTKTLRAVGDTLAMFNGLNPQQILGMLMRGGK